jgi:HEAT repeat protein
MLRDDPAPAVRAAAVSRLVTVDGEAALPDATRALEDSAPEVRLAAARASARLDPEAVGPLRDVALHGPADAARAALAALSLMGEEAHLILAELAAEHPDPGMRTLAGIAVGQPIGDRH